MEKIICLLIYIHYLMEIVCPLPKWSELYGILIKLELLKIFMPSFWHFKARIFTIPEMEVKVDPIVSSCFMMFSNSECFW